MRFALVVILGVACNAEAARAQAAVSRSTSLLIAESYEKVLARLEGESASREMFASQHVEIVRYTPRKQDKSKKDQQTEGVTRATIDIVGRSCEFGTMCYVMTIQASEKQTIIDVALTQPVGMLRKQQYHYLIIPQGDKQTTISISHDLDVVLMKRRLRIVNRIIANVTYKKACEQVVTLTESMSNCVRSLANREKPKDDSSASSSQSNDEEMEDAVEEPADDATTTDGGKSPSTKPSADSDQSNLPESSPSDQPLEAAQPSSSDASPATARPPATQQQDSTQPLEAQPLEAQHGGKQAETPKPEVPQPETQQPETQQPETPKAGTQPTGQSEQTQEPLKVQSSTGESAVEQAAQPSVAKDEQSKSSSSDLQTNKEAPKPKLRITVEGISVASGALRIAIFDSSEQYKKFDATSEEANQGDAFRKVAVKVSKTGKLVYEFKDLPYGKYAIAAFHDKDGNKKLNASVIGLPSEPYGFSRDARGSFGAPKFEDAVIKFDESNTTFSFKIK